MKTILVLFMIGTTFLLAGCKADREVKSDNTHYINIDSPNITCVDGLEMFANITYYGRVVLTYKRTKDDKLIECDPTKFSQRR